MNSDLEKAVEILRENPEYTCVFCKDDKTYTSTSRGIRPILDFLETTDLNGFSAADKVVGKGASFVYVLLGVRSLHAKVMSKGASEVLTKYGIYHTFDTLTDSIINRAKTGICPMEEAVQNISDPNEALEAIKSKLLNM